MFMIYGIPATYVDIFFLLLIFLSGFIGFQNGFLKELLKLLIWIFSIMSSLLIFDETSKIISNYTNAYILIKIISFLMPLILIFIIYSILIKIFVFNINDSQNVFGNQIFGFLFGIIKGLLIVVLCFGGLMYLFNTKENFPEFFSQSLLFNPLKKFSIYVMEFLFSMI